MKMKIFILLFIVLSINFNNCIGKDLPKQNSSPAVFSTNNDKIIHSEKFSLPWFLFSSPIEYEMFASEVILNIEKMIIENNKNDTNGICSRGVVQMINYLGTQGNGQFSMQLFISSMKELSSMCGLDGIYSKISNSILNILKNGLHSIDIPSVGDTSKLFYCFRNTISYYSDRSQHAQELGKCIGSQIINVEY
ncbi:hypothetical protein RB653_007349 [Dictyostelium firmibasis]|uniref:Lipoprotein n=1 Tax=Dictyostelium firmibasis TaxID=79012 RepID=A0AAN7TV86_9MYCE